jgi:hypothetical protein
VRLVCQRFKEARAADRWLEVFIYDMGDGNNAFSVFSSQRRKDAQPLAFAPYAYLTSNALFAVHGRFYVEIVASTEADSLLGAAKTIAQNFIRNTPAEKAAVSEAALFPEQQLAGDSITLIPADAFGFEGFNRIYTAEYQFDDHRPMAYLSLRGTPAEAKGLALSYAAFLSTYGGRAVEAQLPIPGARLIEILDSYEIIFFHQAYVAGVREAATADEAILLAARLYHRLNEEGDEPRAKP